MQRYVIERDLPGAGSLSAAQLKDIGKISNAALRDVGQGIQWEQSYVTSDRIYCVYLAETEEMIRDHARRGGFPCTKVSQVGEVLGPLTEHMQVA
ncbi:MAG: DUF4242 domain-containing protein [bacterium]